MIDDFLLSVVNPPLRNGIINEAERAFRRWLQFEQDERQAKYKEYRAYYDGNHDVVLTDRQKEYLHLKAGQTFDANFCPIVIDALAERLSVTSFDVVTATGELDERQGGNDGDLWRIFWQLNRMDAIQSDVHTAALRDGDSFIIVEWDNERQIPRITHELAYDGVDGVSVIYQNEQRGKVWFAFKKWRATNNEGETYNRLNIYTDDAIYKFTDDVRVTNTSRLFFHWREYVAEENDPWPIPWVDGSGQPLGVPVIHFRYGATGYNYGLSRLDNIIPQQNALNKMIADLLATADVSAFRIYTMIGDDPVDEDGNELKIMPGGFISSMSQPGMVEIGHIPGEDLGPLNDIVNGFITRIAQMSRTPLSYFQASQQIASAENQAANESGLVSMAENTSIHFGNAWEDVMGMARRLFNAFGSGGLDVTGMISTVWQPFKIINEEEAMQRTAETASKKSETFERLIRTGVTREAAAVLSGYTQDEAELLATDARGRFLIPEA